MNKHIRYGVQFLAVVAYMAPLFLPGCILVVEDDRHRDRRYIGTEWRLEVVFYRTQTLSPSAGDVEFTFVDDTRFEGVSGCGAFSGTYDVDDEGNVSVNSFESENAGCTAGDTSTLFQSQFVRATSLSLDNNLLRINTDENNYLVFSGS